MGYVTPKKSDCAGIVIIPDTFDDFADFFNWHSGQSDFLKKFFAISFATSVTAQ